jgi:hypothetical protein
VSCGPMMVDGSELEDEIARLRDLDLPTLRARWRIVFRRKAPEPLPRHLLFRILAYRLQAERLGDLDKETVRLLDRIASGNGGKVTVRLLASNPALTGFSRDPCWCGSGTGRGNASWSWTEALPGTARPIEASPQSLSP